MLMCVSKSLTTRAFDAATLAWITAVIGAGGTVSQARRVLVNDLIAGLKADGVWTSLDRLWLFAMENTTQALVDLVADATATPTAPSFTVDRGYTGNGTSSVIDSNFNATTVSGAKFVQDSACLFAWSNTSGVSSLPWIAGVNSGTSVTVIAPMFTDNNDYVGVNDGGGGPGYSIIPGTGETGLYLDNRVIAANDVLDRNGIPIANGAWSSTAVSNGTFTALAAYGISFGDRQVSCFGFGGGLSAGDRVNIYARLRTFMTAVGVP